MRWGGTVAPTQKFVLLGCLDMGGSDDVHMEKWVGQLKRGFQTPGTPSNSSTDLVLSLPLKKTCQR